MAVGEFLLLSFIDVDLKGVGFSISLALVGAGLGLLASQLGNVIMSSVSPERGGEAGGLQGTSQNLGASLGTALIGSILIAALAASFQDVVIADPNLSPELKQQAITAAEKSANFVTTEQVRTAATEAGVSAGETDALVAAYAEAQLAALRAALAGVAVFALVALYHVRHMPTLARPGPEAAAM
jgi:hypothetical protein